MQTRALTPAVSFNHRLKGNLSETNLTYRALLAGTSEFCLDTHCIQGAFHSNIVCLVYSFCLIVECDISNRHLWNMISHDVIFITLLYWLYALT